MTPRELIATAYIPGGDEMKLFRRGGDFMIVIDRNELMSTRMNGSEIALGESCRRVAGRRGARVLIGGLGMGFTLGAALGVLAQDARVVVAELVPEVIAWARGPLAGVFGGILDDRRVVLRSQDVAVAIGDAAREGGYDAILLDVDNGPDGLVRAGNDRIYAARGLAAARAALTEGGVLAVWSAAPDAKFARALRDAGFAVEETVVAARIGGKGPRHTIWYATRT